MAIPAALPQWSDDPVAFNAANYLLSPRPPRIPHPLPIVSRCCALAHPLDARQKNLRSNR